jgi:deazaflavin-dependent oxidoreductase (nitroreductase family)
MIDEQTEATHHEHAVPEYSADERTCSLTTFGRNNGRAHEVALRYAMRGDTMYLLSDEGGEAEWVQNLIKNPEVSVRVDSQTFSGMGRIVTNPGEDATARRLLAGEYEGWQEGQPLSEWANAALPVAVDRTPHIH